VIACHPVLLVECGVHVCPWGDAHGWTCSEQVGETCMCVCLWLGLGQNDGRTPLYTASFKGHVGVVEALVKAGAALNQAAVCDCMPSCAAGGVVSLGWRTRADMW
jgi:hypothetical protein